MDMEKERETVEIGKPYIVWERHVLSNEKLGEYDGDVPHYFWTYEKARTFMTTVITLHPDKAPYVRVIGFSSHVQGYDFGSYIDFLILVSKDEPLPGFGAEEE